MENNFADWLEEEIQKRGWQPSDMAREANTYPATITRILNRMRNPGPDICLAIAKALDMPPEEVFRKAGLLPDLPYGPLEQMTLQELHDLMRNLTPRDRRDVLEYARMRYRLLREDREQVRGNKKAQAGSLRSGESPA
jgi:transcriptional regulator with XRE-family HTH domain